MLVSICIHSQETDTHALGGIRIRNPKKPPTLQIVQPPKSFTALHEVCKEMMYRPIAPLFFKQISDKFQSRNTPYIFPSQWNNLAVVAYRNVNHIYEGIFLEVKQKISQRFCSLRGPVALARLFSPSSELSSITQDKISCLVL